MSDPLPPYLRFVFTDDLAVFDSLDDAASWHEFREPITAYDASGNAVVVGHDNTRTPVPGNRRDELTRELRRHFLSFAAARPDLLDEGKVGHASHDELIRLAVQWAYRSPPRREHWWQFWRAPRPARPGGLPRAGG